MIKGVVVYGARGVLTDRLEKRFYEQGMPFISHSITQFGWKTRLLESREIARSNPDDVLIFLDAWDTLMLGTRQELEALGLETGVTFAAQKFCWPDGTREPEYDAIQPPNVGPWRFINSNPMAGLGRNIAAAIDWGWERFPMKTNTNLTYEYDVDERFLTNLYLSEARSLFDIRLDTQCRLNQTFLASVPGDIWYDAPTKRFHNKIHDTMPVFAHFNGRTHIPDGLL